MRAIAIIIIFSFLIALQSNSQIGYKDQKTLNLAFGAKFFNPTDKVRLACYDKYGFYVSDPDYFFGVTPGMSVRMLFPTGLLNSKLKLGGEFMYNQFIKRHGGGFVTIGGPGGNEIGTLHFQILSDYYLFKSGPFIVHSGLGIGLSCFNELPLFKPGIQANADLRLVGDIKLSPNIMADIEIAIIQTFSEYSMTFFIPGIGISWCWPKSGD